MDKNISPVTGHDHPWIRAYDTGVPPRINPKEYTSIVQMLEQSFARYADRDSFRCMGKTLSFQEIDELSRAFAAYLQNDLGLLKGDRVALMMPNVLQYPIALFGALRA